jgi:coproporphyrinogen III oxidase
MIPPPEPALVSDKSRLRDVAKNCIYIPEGGGGKTRVITNGNVFEKGGVNTSVVYGKVTEAMRTHLKMEGDKWFACGLSLVIHPLNPFVPTVHCNYRMLELYDADVSPATGINGRAVLLVAEP